MRQFAKHGCRELLGGFTSPQLRHENPMTQPITARDYSLVGQDGKLAVEKGLASAQWYACPVPRKRLKELMQRRDGPAVRDTGLWIASFAAAGGLA